eukprot:TRINITY_DN1515_c0_g1_i4.p2 TRINITY_DN1515_c0_g1~~TRINITY_DN1515_c0_g1_i4.p2  ORF type:complete len:175 (+),score=28.27 TRINITY_DN1515_c0_g1_i4:27-527(+)
MQSLTFFIVLLGLAVAVYGSCVAPPSDLQVCVLPTNARVPQEFANTNADREIISYFNFLKSIKAQPTQKCAEAYVDFTCSQAYPRCNGDANSGLSYEVNACYYQCSNFVEECRGQLIGVDRPDCGQFSVSEECSSRLLKFESSSASSLASGSLYIVAAIAALLFAM